MLAELAASADVIVENLSPGVMDRFGIPPEKVHAENSGCVYLSMRGYRPDPSTAGLRAYAPVLTGGAGIEALVSYPGKQPLGMMTFAYSDACAAAARLLLTLAGLYGRRNNCCGSYATRYQHDTAVFAGGYNLVQTQLGSRSEGLTPVDSACLVTAEQLATSPWTRPDLFTAVPRPWLPTLQLPRLPWQLGDTFPEAHGPGPELGADTDHVLNRRLGLDEDAIAQLRTEDVLT